MRWVAMGVDVPAFEAWLRAHDVHMDEQLSISSTAEGQLGVFAREDALIERDAIVAHLPLSLVLSARSSSLSRQLDGRRLSEQPVLELAAHLCVEMQLGAASPWQGYLVTLPRPENIHLASRWSDEARAWLRGTELGRILADNLDAPTVLEAFYQQRVVPELPVSVSTTLEGFLHAHALVSSRAFVVDAYHGLAMCSLADVCVLHTLMITDSSQLQPLGVSARQHADRRPGLSRVRSARRVSSRWSRRRQWR